jgi:hypothetical protein
MTVADNIPTKGATEKDASVFIAGTKYDLPMRKGTLGPDVVDISSLYQETGRFTYDPSFTSTASCEFRRDAHPMAIMVGVVGALSAFLSRLDRHQGSGAAGDS